MACITFIFILSVIWKSIQAASPVIGGSFTATVQEGKLIGTVVSTSFTATDSDGDTLQYSFIGSHASYFNIDPTSGVVSTTTVLDRDATGVITSFDNLILQVSDGATTATATLTITLEDINDNAPVFASSLYTGSVEEGSVSGTSVVSITATDADDGVNKVFNYAIFSGDSSGKFTIGGNDVVTTAVPVDYETETSFTIIVTATDTGTSPLTGTTTIIITVSNVNEFTPAWGTFSPAWTDATTPFDLSESASIGTLVVTIAATDNDAGVDGEITYELGTVSPSSGSGSTAGLFRVDSVTGDLTTIGTFDLENIDGVTYYDAVVKATDGGSAVKSVERTVRIGLVDFNDNAPVFTSPTSHVILSETAGVGTSVHEFTVTDVDQSSDFTYTIVEGNSDGYFEFHSVFLNRIILQSVIDLDVSATDTYNLKITVTDGGTPELTGTAYVTISVSNANEHTPVFSADTISETISEDSSVGHAIATISATDTDYGSDGAIEYSIVSGSTDTFQIDTSSGQLTLIKSIDYETTQSYVLKIQAKDGGSPSNSATSTVSISVSDVNDNQPTCTTLSTISLLETAAVGDTVATLSCSDADSSTTLIYTELSSEFAISSLGVITLALGVEYESATQSYNFDIRVSDGTLFTTLIARVNISPVNEFTPTFVNTAMTVSENEAVGTSLITFTATDNDYSPHDVTSYSIQTVSNGGSGYFSIDATSGEIRLVKTLDYDNIVIKNYEVVVVAVDGGGLEGTGTVTFSVADVNDNSPSCLQSLHVLSVPEDTNIPSELIADLGCSDLDTGVNADMTFTLTQNPGSAFTLIETGTAVSINITSNMDFETQTTYSLEVSVVDGGIPPLSTTVSVEVAVSDINDGGPSFGMASYSANVSEDSSVGTKVLTVIATDPDYSNSSFGNLLYSILSGDNDDKFSIDSSSGEIKTNGNLDRESVDTYDLIVQVKEQALTYSATVTVSLSILDVNDNAPICTSMSFAFVLNETINIGTVLQELDCSDSDSIMYGTLSYSLISGDTNIFELSTNKLNLKTSVDYESGTTSFDIVIHVSDGTNDINVTGSVTFKDVNEDGPVFSSGLSTVDVGENTTIGTTVLTVSATDTDTADILTYSITSATTNFNIDSTLGHVILIKQLDRETIGSHILTISVSDGENINTISITVTVIDVNDNPPIFNPVAYSGNVVENNEDMSSVILTVIATDDDDPLTDSNGNITFSISGGDRSGDFQINAFTGELTASRQLDYEKTQSYTLVILAVDRMNDSLSLSGTAFVTVTIMSVNEFDPIFNGTYTETISEDINIGTSVITVYTTDADTGTDGQVFYSCTHAKFYIDSDSGILYVKDNLDYETTTVYSVDVTATDRGTIPRNTTTLVTITLTDVNDNKPICSPSSYSTSQREEIPPSTVLVTLNCFDDDSGINGNLSYSIVSVNSIVDDDMFSIDSVGVISIESSLDYENTTIHSLKVHVIDGGTPNNTATVTVNVDITDVNEHDPMFSKTLYTISLSETTPVGSVVLNISAVDNDTSESVYYYFNTTSHDFDIDYNTGQVKLKSLLDKETTPIYNLVVFALDSGTVDSSRSTSATVVITILDENENPPTFTPSIYVVSFSENTPVGMSIVTLVSTDSDNDNVIYSIESGNDQLIFAINETSGLIELSSNLDYENETTHSLIVKAKDSRGLFSTGKVVVSVTGYNEFVPVFSPNSSTVFVPENATIGTTIVTLFATDEDIGDGGTITYSLNTSSTEYTVESITGIVQLAGLIDREARSEYFVDILAIDGGISPAALTSTYSLTVSITDINDNIPICSSNSITAIIPEDTAISSSIIRLNCTDSDDDPNSLNNKTLFTISSGNTANSFDLDNTTGHLTLLNSLDRETISGFTIVVHVTDSGSEVFTTTVSVFITVSDINDNTPLFTNDTFYFNANENIEISSVVGQVIATDTDYEQAGSIYYSILTGNDEGKFAVDALNGKIKIIASLDFETTTNYNLTIKATDNGNPVLFSTAYVVIEISDINDNIPSCSQSVLSSTIPENTTTGFDLLQIECSDNDSISTLTYFLITPIDEFDINISSGVISVANTTLDTETTSLFTVLINVTDETFSTTVTIYITVSDINEHAPHFLPTGPYDVSLTEDFPIAGTIYTVSANDNDYSKATLKYSIISGLSNSEMTIGSESGVLQLRKSFDAESQSVYSLGVQVTDGMYIAYTNLTISITDVNDNYPSCDQIVYNSILEENTTIGSLILSPVCSDRDISNSALTFTIISGHDDGKFDINETAGFLTLNNSLDYETTTQYTLTVSVTDNGIPSLSITATIYVVVTPINEKAPSFGSNIYEATIDEDYSLNNGVITVNASDPDTGLFHGTIRYTISSGDANGVFTIDTTGQIKLVKAVDREANDFYNVTILASDGLSSAVDSLTSTAFVSITISDVNDNYPQFIQTIYSVSINENAAVGATIQTIGATDDDINENGPEGFVYSILSGNTGDTFNILGNEIILAKEIDRETTSFYQIKLQVTDNGTTTLSDHAYLNIIVLAVNEYTPVFGYDSNNITINESTPIGTILYSLSASDNDTGNYGTLRYYITGNVTYTEFLLDEFTGQLTVLSALDYDVAPNEYNLTVNAVDKGFNGSDSQSDEVWLYIKLIDENDHAPVFTHNTYTFTIYENMTVGSYIGVVSASDKDSGVNGAFTYSVISGDGSGYFSVNETTGEVTTTHDIDYETKNLYSVVIEAKDTGNSPLSSRCLVKVVINDLNDNAPTFQPDDFAINLSEDVAIGTSITTMLAKDIDSSVSNNNVFTYIIESESFLIDSNTGVVTTSTLMDRENISSYIVNVTAADQGTPPMTGTATLTILIDDINDNNPIVYGVYQESVSEDSGINTVVITLNATDPDDGANGELTFSIVNGNSDEDLKIDPGMGLIQVSKTLDRERTSSYYLIVNITDNGTPTRFTEVNVTVDISDINDNIPLFTSQNLTFSLPEDVTVGYEIGNISASDADTGHNGQISYSMPIFWSGLNSHFKINESNGVISTSVSLDRETFETYVILCKIADNGSPVFTSTVNITLTIIDVNDNTPEFNASTYTASFPENQDVGTSLLSVFVTDIDIGVNKDIVLSIDTSTTDGQTADTYIAVNSASKTLSVKQNIDREITASFIFTLIATDSGTPPKSSNVSVTFTVEDLNDNSPLFTSSFYNVEIPYDDNCHVIVGEVTATDSDEGDIVTYEMMTTEFFNIFNLNSTSGVITLVSTPSENVQYDLEIVATDTSSNNASVRVRVDTFESESAMVTFTLGMDTASFDLIEQTFLTQLNSVIQQNYSNSQTRRWCVKETADSIIDVSVYVLEDITTNYAAKFVNDKTMLSAAVIKSLVTNSDGSLALTDAIWDQFNITTVKSFTATTSGSGGSSDTKWISTTTGIAVLTTICILVLVFILLACVLFKSFRKKKNEIKTDEEILQEKRTKLKVVNEDELEKPPAMKKQTMQTNLGEYDDEKLSYSLSRSVTPKTNISTKRFNSEQKLVKSRMVSTAGQSVKNDKFTDEIDKSKIQPPVIYRGNMPKIDRKTHYKENDWWSDISHPYTVQYNREAKTRKIEHPRDQVDQSK